MSQTLVYLISVDQITNEKQIVSIFVKKIVSFIAKRIDD